jgi:3-isopropylmalate dehydratase small subunit
MSRFENSFLVQYESQKDVAERFDEARKNEVNTKREQKKAKRVFKEIEKQMQKAKMDLENKESKAREATNKRKKIQKVMRASLLSAADELRDSGYFYPFCIFSIQILLLRHA